MPRGSVQLLSDYKGGKIAVTCSCGISRRYDASKMLTRIGDLDIPELLDRLALAEGCTKSRRALPPKHRPECSLQLDLSRMRQP